MIRPLAAALAAFIAIVATHRVSSAQDGRRPDGPPTAAPGDRGPDRAPRDRDDRPGKGADDGLERARAAARAADPRFQGLERAREAARGADPAGGVDCLSAREARGAIGQKRAIPLAQAVRSARDAWDGEVIDYRLCTYDGRLAYELTLLNADGRVARVRVEALDGKLVGVR